MLLISAPAFDLLITWAVLTGFNTPVFLCGCARFPYEDASGGRRARSFADLINRFKRGIFFARGVPGGVRRGRLQTFEGAWGLRQPALLLKLPHQGDGQGGQARADRGQPGFEGCELHFELCYADRIVSRRKFLHWEELRKVIAFRSITCKLARELLYGIRSTQPSRIYESVLSVCRYCSYCSY